MIKYWNIINNKGVSINKVWSDSGLTPTDYDADTWIEVGADFEPEDTRTYAELRAEAYPSLTEQADMAYWDRQNGTTTLDDAISAVKTTYPKPGV